DAIIIEMINYFGHLGGFDILLSRFQEENLSLFAIFAYLKPFNNCIELLTQKTIETYFVPIIEIVPKFFVQMSDEELKNEVKNDGKSKIIFLIIKILPNFSLKLPNSDVAKSIELLKLKIILRLHQISPFNGKMNALNDLNKLIISFSTESQTNYTFVNNVNEFLHSSEQ